MAGFIFGAGTPYRTYEDLKRERASADGLAEMAMSNAGAQTLPEGLINFGTGILAALMKGRVDRAEKAGKADYNSRFNSITKSLLGGKSSGGTKASASVNAAPEVASGIKATAESLGIDPVDLATAISYETAGTFNPMKAGPTTKWGQHKGLIQFGEPQAAKYGVDWNNPVGSQLGPDGAVARYLKDTGVKPGMGLLDIYSAINAGGVGRYNLSDEAAGGAPGSVAEKVLYQMGDHRAKAQALLGGAGGGNPLLQNAAFSPGQMNSRPDFQPPAAPAPVAPVAASPAQAPAPPPGIVQPAQVVPVSAPASAGRMTAFQRAEMARLNNEVGLSTTQRDSRRQAIMGGQGGGFFTSLLPADAAPAQVAQVQEVETNLQSMPIEQIAELANSPYAEDWQKNLMQTYLQHRLEQEFAPPPDPLEQRKKMLELKKLEQDLRPDPKSRPATPEEKQAFGLPESAPVFIKPDGTPELLDTSKVSPPQQSRPATPEEKQAFGLPENAPVFIKPDGTPEILDTSKINPQGYRPASPEEKKAFGVPPDAPLVFGPDGKPTMLGGGNTTVNVGGGTDKQIFDETKSRADAARAARSGLNALTEAQRALPGAITGAAANERLALQKLASLFGVGDTSAIADTETFRSAIAPQVAAMMKATVGSTQISNADREFAEKAAGGAITLDAQSIQRLINIMWVANSEIVRGFNTDLDKVYPEGAGYDRERALFRVPQAERAYMAPIGPQMPGGQTPQQQPLPQQTAPQQPAPASDTPPPGIDSETWKYMTPEERMLWQQN